MAEEKTENVTTYIKSPLQPKLQALLTHIASLKKAHPANDSNVNSWITIEFIEKIVKKLDNKILPMFDNGNIELTEKIALVSLIKAAQNLINHLKKTQPGDFDDSIKRLITSLSNNRLGIDFLAIMYALICDLPQSIYPMISFLNPEIFTIDLRSYTGINGALEFALGGGVNVERTSAESGTADSFNFKYTVYANPIEVDQISPQGKYTEYKKSVLEIIPRNMVEYDRENLTARHFYESRMLTAFIGGVVTKMGEEIPGFGENKCEFKYVPEDRQGLTGIARLQAIDVHAQAVNGWSEGIAKQIKTFEDTYDERNSFAKIYGHEALPAAITAIQEKPSAQSMPLQVAVVSANFDKYHRKNIFDAIDPYKLLLSSTKQMQLKPLVEEREKARQAEITLLTAESQAFRVAFANLPLANVDTMEALEAQVQAVEALKQQVNALHDKTTAFSTAYNDTQYYARYAPDTEALQSVLKGLTDLQAQINGVVKALEKEKLRIELAEQMKKADTRGLEAELVKLGTELEQLRALEGEQKTLTKDSWALYQTVIPQIAEVKQSAWSETSEFTPVDDLVAAISSKLEHEKQLLKTPDAEDEAILVDLQFVKDNLPVLTEIQRSLKRNDKAIPTTVIQSILIKHGISKDVLAYLSDISKKNKSGVKSIVFGLSDNFLVTQILRVAIDKVTFKVQGEKIKNIESVHAQLVANKSRLSDIEALQVPTEIAKKAQTQSVIPKKISLLKSVQNFQHNLMATEQAEENLFTNLTQLNTDIENLIQQNQAFAEVAEDKSDVEISRSLIKTSEDTLINSACNILRGAVEATRQRSETFQTALRSSMDDSELWGRNIEFLLSILEAGTRNHSHIGQFKAQGIYTRLNDKDKIDSIERAQTEVTNTLCTVFLGRLKDNLLGIQQQIEGIGHDETRACHTANQQKIAQVFAKLQQWIVPTELTGSTAFTPIIAEINDLRSHISEKINEAINISSQIDLRIAARNSQVALLLRELTVYKTTDSKRIAFISSLKAALNTYATTGNSQPVLDSINARIKDFKGIKLQSLMSDIAITLITIDERKLNFKEYTKEEAETVIVTAAKLNTQSFQTALDSITILDNLAESTPGKPQTAAPTRQLARDVRQDLYRFLVTTPNPTPVQTAAFKQKLHYRLHSKDTVLTKLYGAEKWKAVVANIAGTIFSLLYFVGSKAITGKAAFFYHESSKQKQIAKVEEKISQLISDRKP